MEMGPDLMRRRGLMGGLMWRGLNRSLMPAPSGTSYPVTGVMLFGQSNAEHRGNTSTLDAGLNGSAAFTGATIDTVDTFTWPASTYPRMDLQPVGAGALGMGCELSLGRFIVNARMCDPSRALPMSKMGVNGAAIATWRTGANLDNFDEYWIAQEAATSPAHVISDGVYWQGEADAVNSTLSGLYESQLTALMLSVRTAHPGLKRMGIVRLNNAATGGSITPSDRAAVRAAQAAWVAANPGFAYLIDTDGISLDPADNVHYLSNGYWIAGNMIGMAMLTACGMTLPDEDPGFARPFVRKLFRNPLQHTSVVSGTIMITPTPANVGDQQVILLAPNALGIAITASDAQGFVREGSTVDSNATGVHILLDVWHRTYNGTQGSPVFDTGATQQRRGGYGFSVGRGGTVDASTTSVTNANVTAVTIPAVTTLANNSLAVFCLAMYSGTDSTLSSIAAAGLSDEALIQQSRISNSCKISIIAGTLAAAGSSGTCTATASVNSNQARRTLSFPPA